MSLLRPPDDPPLPGFGYANALRHALLLSHELLRERDPIELRRRVVRGALELSGASSARFHVMDEAGWWSVEPVASGLPEIPPLAAEMEIALLPRGLARDRSLISSHPLLDRDLIELAARCQDFEITTHVLLLRANQQTCGAVALHWLGEPRPVDYERRGALYAYWDNAGLAIATALERARIEGELRALSENAYRDRLTGLPSALALERTLDDHDGTWPLSALVLDFDGLREANAAFGYTNGGDRLIAAVGAALGAFAAPGEHPARMYTAGDEFAVLLPDCLEDDAVRRRIELEAMLDALPVPPDLAGVYRGASVGAATRRPGERPGQVLGRAAAAMRARKTDRKAQNAPV